MQVGMGKQNFMAGEAAVTTEFMGKIPNSQQSSRVHLLWFVVALVHACLSMNF